MTHADQTRRRAIQAYLAKVPVAEIDATMGVSRHTLYAWLRRLDVCRQYKTNPDEIRSLHAEGLSDREIARRLGVDDTYVWQFRKKHGLPANYIRGWPKTRATAAAVALMLLAGGAQAQGTGWQGHPHQTPDPFAQMLTGDGKSCCSGVDCAYTEDCVTTGSAGAALSPDGGGQPGVIGPDGLCHALTEAALQTKNCAPGGTSACFYQGRLRCACTGGT